MGVRGTNGGSSVVSAAICAAGQPLFRSALLFPLSIMVSFCKLAASICAQMPDDVKQLQSVRRL